MKYIEAPTDYCPKHNETTLFLAGGITDCPDWQEYVVSSLLSLDIIVFNPRRANWSMSSTPVEQIAWEHKFLATASNILFWFPKETLCPIVLFEYGKFLVSPKRLFVGCDRDYKRRVDIFEQTRLERPDLFIHSSLDNLIMQVVRTFDGKVDNSNRS